MKFQKKNEALILFGSSIRRLRLDAGLSQEELADLADIDRSYLGAIERGEHNVAVLNIFKIAKALKVKPSKLFDIFEMD